MRLFDSTLDGYTLWELLPPISQKITGSGSNPSSLYVPDIIVEALRYALIGAAAGLLFWLAVQVFMIFFVICFYSLAIAVRDELRLARQSREAAIPGTSQA